MRSNSFLLSQVSGQIGKKIVVKHYGKKIVITRAPDMSGIQPSPLQKTQPSSFAAAVAYARHINNTPELKAAYIKKAGKSKSVYQYVLKEFLQNRVQGMEDIPGKD